MSDEIIIIGIIILGVLFGGEPYLMDEIITNLNK